MQSTFAPHQKPFKPQLVGHPAAQFAAENSIFSQLKAQLSALPDSDTAQFSSPSSQEVAIAATPPREPLFQGSLMGGMTRMLKKTFLRPRGWAELALAILPGHVGVFFLVKSFVEGLVGADSLFISRRLGFKALGISKQHDGRTVLGAIGQWLSPKALATA